MTPAWTTLTLAHLLGLALGLGGATVKLVLLARCKADPALVRSYVSVARPITRLLLLGLVLATLSGVGWLLLGAPWRPLLVAKVVLVGGIWVIGPAIDKVFEPRFVAQAPAPGAPVSAELARAWTRYVAVEGVATGLFYAAGAVGALL